MTHEELVRLTKIKDWLQDILSQNLTKEEKEIEVAGVIAWIESRLRPQISPTEGEYVKVMDDPDGGTDL